MDQIFFDGISTGFFSKERHGSGVVKGMKAIEYSEYIRMLEGMSRGGVISADSDGAPLLTFIDQSVKVDAISRAQGKAALIRAGLWQGVLDYVSSIDDATEKAVAEVALHDTSHYQRTSPFLIAAAHALGLTNAQLDDLFIQASLIEL